MQDKEKKLIENLFDRLKNAEVNSSSRDEEANILIKNLVKNQPSSSYYLIQTVLIQETAIKKMNEKIEELKNKVLQLELKNNIKKPSFLSGFFSKTKSSSPITPNTNNTWKNESSPSMQSIHTPVPQNNNISTNRSGFLTNALQTATGVAGGMILGNMLMNIFQHSKPEEDIFNTINQSSTEDDAEILNNTTDTTAHNSNFIDYEDNTDLEKNDNYEFTSDAGTYDDIDETDTNDDNLI